MKKIWGLGVVTLMSMFVLTACSSKSSSKSQPTSSTGNVGLSIKSGTYVVPEGKSVSADKQYLALKVEIDNKAKKELAVSTYDLNLYDKDGNKMADVDVYDDDDDQFAKLDSADISGGKSTTGYVVFNVEKDQKYELHYQPSVDGEKQKAVKVKVDATEYQDNTKKMTNLAKAYVDQVFLGAKANEQVKLANDLKQEHTDFNTKFSENLGQLFDSYKPSTAELQQVVDSFESADTKKASATYTIDQMLPGSATVYVKPETIDFGDVDTDAIISDFTDKNEGRYDDYDKAMQDAEKYLLQQLPTKFEATKVSTPEYMDGEGYKLKLVKEKGKWSVDSTDDSDNYDFGELQTAYMGGLSD